MPDLKTFSTNGGNYSAAIFSGAVAPATTRAAAVAVGSDVLLFSGGGRLTGLYVHNGFLAMSGVQLNVYDGAAPVSGGPLPASGHVPLAAVPAAYGVSGQLTGPGLITMSVPFFSGLCLNSRSGQPGVTVFWTPEDFSNR